MMQARRSTGANGTSSIYSSCKTDTGGLLVGAIVHPADVQDRDGAPLLLEHIRYQYPWLRHVFADGGYAGSKLLTALDKSLTRNRDCGIMLWPLAS
jgi:hypothetical protein